MRSKAKLILRPNEPRLWFAWYPVEVIDGTKLDRTSTWVWLEMVYRCKPGGRVWKYMLDELT